MLDKGRYWVPLLALLMFVGLPVPSGSFFLALITVSGVFFAFSVLILSVSVPFRVPRVEFVEALKKVGAFAYLEKWAVSKGFDEKIARKIAYDPKMVKDFSGIFAEVLTAFLSPLMTVLVPSEVWQRVVWPFLISIMLALAGLLYSGVGALAVVYSGVIPFVLGMMATLFVFYSILNMIWNLLELRHQSADAEATKALDLLASGD